MSDQKSGKTIDVIGSCDLCPFLQASPMHGPWYECALDEGVQGDGSDTIGPIIGGDHVPVSCPLRSGVVMVRIGHRADRAEESQSGGCRCGR